MRSFDRHLLLTLFVVLQVQLASQLLSPWPSTPHVLENGTLMPPSPVLVVALNQPLEGLARTVVFIEASADDADTEQVFI